MGYQESFIKFKNEKTLRRELRKYERRNKAKDIAELFCVDRVKKEIYPFKKNELVAVVCGERSEQRDRDRLEEGLGITNVQDIVFIDNPIYWNMAINRNCKLGDILEEHFEKLTNDEYAKLLM